MKLSFEEIIELIRKYQEFKAIVKSTSLENKEYIMKFNTTLVTGATHTKFPVNTLCIAYIGANGVTNITPINDIVKII